MSVLCNLFLVMDEHIYVYIYCTCTSVYIYIYKYIIYVEDIRDDLVVKALTHF